VSDQRREDMAGTDTGSQFSSSASSPVHSSHRRVVLTLRFSARRGMARHRRGAARDKSASMYSGGASQRASGLIPHPSIRCDSSKTTQPVLARPDLLD
jgi:hypothetical protein